MAKKGKRAPQGVLSFRKEIFDEGVSRGLDYFLDAHPEFKGNEKVLIGYINKKELNDYVTQEFANVLRSGRVGHQETLDLVAKIAEEVSSGNFFNKQGKGFLLENTRLKKYAGKSAWDFFRHGKIGAGFEILKAKGALKRKDYLDQASQAFTGLYELMKTGDYAKRMPDLAEAVTDVYDAGFFGAAVDILNQGGVLGKGRYNTLKRAIHSGAEDRVKRVTTAIEKYAMPQRAAAAIIGILGLGVLLSANTLTGAVVGATSTNPIAIAWGAAALILGAWLGFRKK